MRTICKFLVGILFINWSTISLEKKVFWHIDYITFTLFLIHSKSFFSLIPLCSYQHFQNFQKLNFCWLSEWWRQNLGSRGHFRNATHDFWILDSRNITFLPKMYFEQGYLQGNWYWYNWVHIITIIDLGTEWTCALCFYVSSQYLITLFEYKSKLNLRYCISSSGKIDLKTLVVIT